jgi:hypothetical protein
MHEKAEASRRMVDSQSVRTLPKRSRGKQTKKTAGGGKEDENPTGWRDHLGGKSLSLALYL